METLAAGAADMVRSLRGRGFASPILMADQRLAHEAGASEAQELAGALATTAELVRSVSDAGLDAETVAGRDRARLLGGRRPVRDDRQAPGGAAALGRARARIRLR